MKTPSNKLLDCLINKGWRIESVLVDDFEWWVDEIWVISSIWSPEGVLAYLSFLVYPQHDGLRKKGQAVWRVAVSGVYPVSKEEACSNGIITMNEISKEDFSEFIQNIELLRSGAKNDIGL